jgi:uncharacterized repeat protein (TIGR02543 family)
MKKLIGKRMLSLVLSLLICMSLGSGIIFAFADFAFAEDPAIVQGPTVTADPDSPTGYTVTFVYYNPNATQVKLAGDLTLLDVSTGNTRYQPEAWQTGRYHCGGTEFLRDMTKDADGYWSVSIPLHAGGLSYWYRVWDPTQGWSNKRIWDPTSTHPRPAGNTTFRVINNDVLDAVYVPYAEKQNDPVLESRATYELPIADPAQRGTVQYVPYTTILGGSGYYLGVYLPPGYDENRAEPYKVLYLAHGIFGDETDFMIPGNVPNILDNMIARGEIEPTVVVTMGNHFTPDPRFPWPWYDQTNAANNLVQTILPFIEANFNVSNKREGRAYGGFSYGGMTGGIVIRNYTTTFGFYGFFSGNPSLTTANYDSIAAQVGANALFVFLGRGSFEGNLNACNTIRDNFRTRGIFSETALATGAHDMMTAGMLFTIFARDYLWTIYSVEFDLNGGDSAPIDDAAVMTGHTVAKPADPSREDYTFTGWYLGAEEFDFDTEITGDITLVANWVNYPPVWTPIEDKSIDENRTLTFTVEASDPEGTALTYSTDPLPAGASFNPETQEFTWIPDYTQAGVYQIVFNVSDGAQVSSTEISITVNDVLVTEQIASLKEAVAGMDITPYGIKNALTVKLDQVLKLLSHKKGEKSSEAVQVLNDFIGQANDLRDEGKLTEEQAAELIKAAEETILNIMSSM